MADSEENRILLSQEEMDEVLSDVKHEVRLQEENDIVPCLSQAELDALFSSSAKQTAKKPEKKNFERAKAISVVCARAKWTQNDIKKLKPDEVMPLDTAQEEPVEILCDGHRIAYGILTSSNNKKAVRILSVENL